ncbi:hypothetical protein ES705_34317 [subsurface metagenome]
MSLVESGRGPGKSLVRAWQLPGNNLVPGPITQIVLPAAIAGINAGSCPGPSGKRVLAVGPWTAAGRGELRG